MDEQISHDAANSDAIAIAVDKSTGIRNIAQCCICIRFIEDKYKLTEDIITSSIFRFKRCTLLQLMAVLQLLVIE